MHNNEQNDFDSLVPGRTVDRRTFLGTTIAAGFAVAVQPALGQTPVRTDSEGLTAGEVKVPVADGAVAAYRAMPAKGKGFPIVLVVSEIFGVHEYIQDICRRLAKLGYLAIAPEIFTRQGDPRSLTSIPEIQEKITAKTPDAQVLGDLDACAAWAGKNGGDASRLGITGFCYGGRITWLYTAHNPQVKAAVAWYGRLVGKVTELTPKHPLDVAAQIKVPVLGLYGGLDTGIPLETVDKMEAALRAAGSPAVFQIYDQAPHAFHADYRPSYRKEEAADGWARLQDWFKRLL